MTFLPRRHDVGGWTTTSVPYTEFFWLIEREVDVLGVQLVDELRIQPWPNPWQRRKILKKHLRKVSWPADVSVEQWFTSKGSACWHGSVITKTQKRRQQRMQADARTEIPAAQRPQRNLT